MKTRSANKLSSILSALICVLIGLIIAFIVLIITWSKLNTPSYLYINDSLEGAVWGIKKIFTLGLSDPTAYEMAHKAQNLRKAIAQLLYYAVPLIMCGLSVAFSFKTGLFNIGAPGQYLAGAFTAIFCAAIFKFPWWLSIIAALLMGAIWGSIPGIFKAYLNINEVITCIMTNWIGLFLANLLETNIKGMQSLGADKTRTITLTDNAVILPRIFNNLFGGEAADPTKNIVTIAIIIAIVLAILCWVVIYKTRLGYELVACGLNKNAAKYAGINDKRNIILAMSISGALAGIGGALYFLVGNSGANYQALDSLQGAGFDGISVALLAGSNPLVVIISGFFLAFLQVGGDALQPTYNTEVIDVISSTIIYFTAFSLFFKNVIFKLTNKKELQISKVDGTPLEKPTLLKKEGGDK